jgi:hypothetical protein
MRAIIIIFLACLLIVVGCSTNSACRHDLYESRYEATSYTAATLSYLDLSDTAKSRDWVIECLAIDLSELHKLASGADKDELDRQANLAHLLLKHASKYREQLPKDHNSLQMVIELESFVTNTPDIQIASELAQYLAASSTNQVSSPTP